MEPIAVKPKQPQPKKATPKPKVVEPKVSKPKASKPKVEVKPKLTGTKYDWMRSAGIPESEWAAVDYIVTRESSWNPRAVNASSGACGLVQALPCSKIPGDWSDPVNALKWQKAYVVDRYGGYWNAYNFWKKNSWY